MIHNKDLFFQHVEAIEKLGFVEVKTRRVFPDDSLACWVLYKHPEYSLFYSLEGERGCVFLTEPDKDATVYEQEFAAGLNPTLFVIAVIRHIDTYNKNYFA